MLLIIASLLINTAVPAWAIQEDAFALPSQTGPVQENYSCVIKSSPLSCAAPDVPQSMQRSDEIVRSVEAHPDVAVFPIWVAGTGAVALRQNLAHKIAQASGGSPIAVIYPDIEEPYRSVFTQIINGIEKQAKVHVTNFAVKPNVDVGEINNSLRHQDTKVVIALGKHGMQVASALDSNIGVVVGGVLTVPEDELNKVQVNSLSPDPELLFSRLKGMMPRIKRIFTVYDPHHNAWIMRLAKEAARTQKLEFTAYEAEDLQSAMHAYKEIFANADNSQDALWLPQDSTTVDDNVVIPFVLQESWSKSLAVFSSSFGHVKRGLLFSLYPNNMELGRHLADSALDYLASGENETPGLFPLREVLMAVNLRTAKHLGLKITTPKNFDIAFPEQ